EDLATLIGAVSDNLATNVLLRSVGLPVVDGVRRRLALVGTRLLDQVRVRRGPDDPPTLSTGRADELSRLVANADRRWRGEDHVARWLSGNTDLSMVASAFALDPLAHRPLDHPQPALWNKTGTDTGIRADVGRVGSGDEALSYAVLASWDPAYGDRTDVVLAAMGGLGRWIGHWMGTQPAQPRR
ncbi:MAG: serine hydrolase, partial [Lapillicoccus sp.]